MLLDIINFLDVLAPLAALLFFPGRKNRQLGEHIFIVLYLCTQLAFNALAKYWMYVYVGQPNCFIYQINGCVSMVVLSAYFSVKYLRTITKPAHRIIFLCSAGAAILMLALLVSFENNKVFTSQSYGFIALIINAYSVMFYYQKLRNQVIEHITSTRSFWFISGLFIYYSGSFFIFLTYKVFTITANQHFSILWSVHNIILFIMCILMSKGFLCRSR